MGHRSIMRKLLAPLMVLGLLAAACGDDGGDSEQGGSATTSTTTTAGSDPGSKGNGDAFEALVAAAQEEGSVVIYSADSDDQLAEYARQFKAEYGIDVITQRLTQGPLQQRLDQELEAGRVQVDVVSFTEDPAWSERLASAGELTILDEDELPNMALLAEDAKSEVHLINRVTAMGMAYNTDLVDEADLPATIEELVTNPEFRGRVGTPNMPVGGAYHLWHYAVYEALGQDAYEKWLEDFVVGLDVVAGDSIVPFLTQVGAGELLLALPASAGLANSVARQGAPIAVHYPEPSILVRNSIQGLANGPNPNAGKLFLNWMLSEAAASISCGGGDCAPTHLDVEGQLEIPDGLVTVDVEQASRKGEEEFNDLFVGLLARQ